MSSGAAVLLVTDGARTAHGMALAKQLGIRSAGVEELTGELLSRYMGLVFDVDLRSVELVRRLKRVLPQPGSTCRIFLVDPNVRVTSVHATVLGADASLPFNGTARELQAELQRRLGQGKSKIWPSINQGTQLLDATFRALTDQTPLDTDNVLLAGTSIADAILDEGTEQWLESVRRHHIGTFQHCMLVTGVAAGFGARTGMARNDVITLTIAGLLHDIGKAAVPIAILDKPSALSADEMAVIKTHPVVGARYLGTHSAIDPAIRRTVRHHHELLDGTGYPDGLQGKEIDDLTRILTICDIYAALVERRAYKEPKSTLSAINILEALATAGKVEIDLVRALKTAVAG